MRNFISTNKKENRNQIFIKPLNGHSGCIVNLMRDDKKIFVRKISSCTEYNYRLKKQYKKQLCFRPRHNVYTPKIYNYGYMDNLFFFDMEFISGKTLAEYTSEISVSQIPKFIECLFKCLYCEDCKTRDETSLIFNKKIQELENNLRMFDYLSEAFVILKNFDWSKVYKSPCHGDLTLENILITQNKRLYLIDFLDSFYNSWLIDIAKLFQDLELKWSFRNSDSDLNREIRLQAAKYSVINEMFKMDNGIENIITAYHILLLNILRIYPYVHIETDFNYLDNSVQVLIRKISKIITQNKGVFI